MKLLDKFLQNWRINKVLPFIRKGAKVLDIGCDDRSLFDKIGYYLDFGVGIDPNLIKTEAHDRFVLISGWFPQDLPAKFGLFDVITILAVLEHIPKEMIPEFVQACINALKPDGLIIITVPSTNVDYILAFLKLINAIDGMELQQHYGFDPSQVLLHFKNESLMLVKHKKFQLGLNNLFIIRKRT